MRKRKSLWRFDTKSESSNASADEGNAAPALQPVETPLDFNPELVPDGGATVLSPDLNKSLDQALSKKKHLVEVQHDGGNGEGHAHGHHEKKPSLVSAIASGVVNYLLMFGLCCAYGMIMFDETNAQHRALGVKMNLCTAGLFGFLLAGFCGVKVAIGGPDLNPVVFIGGFVATLSMEIATQLELEHPLSSRRLVEDEGLWRRLGAAASDSDVEFCTGNHFKEHETACQTYADELRATTIFAVAVSTLILGLAFFLSGRFRLTRYASYVPTCVMEAFMSCVGYKVFKYALHFCNYDARQFVPAASVGVPLYFIKAYHIGNPAVVIPLMLFIPLGIFYGVVYGSGSDLDHAGSWMFPAMKNVEFWGIWEYSIGRHEHVNIKAWIKTIPELIIMVIVCFLDCLLKILGTEGKLPVKVDKDREMQLFGAGNLLTAACGSSVGYMQLKFNVINYGILGNMDRRGGFVYAGFCMLTFFTSIEHFNYLPRFFLGTLLFFAGAGFVAENLWGSRKYLSMGEWGQILTILAVFILAGDLLYAVIVGVVLTCGDFIITYAKVPCVVSSPKRGTESSSVRRAPLLTSSLHHILANWLIVVRLKGFIFFASAQSLVAQLRDMMDQEEKYGIPRYRRLHYVIFDLKLMDGMDASTAKVLRKLTVEAKGHKVTILYTNVTPEQEAKLRTQELVSDDHQSFADLDEALHSIEDHILEYREILQERWVRLHPMFALQQRFSITRSAFEPFKDVFLMETARHGCPWRYCSGRTIKGGSTLLWKPGQMNVGLYLVHSGAVALFRELPDPGDPASSWPSPVAVYRQGWFLNREGLVCMPTRYYAIAFEDGELVYWSHEQWRRMDRERPRMSCEIQRTVMKQQAWDSEKSDPTKGAGIQYLPEEMLLRLNGIRVAQALGAYKFYDPTPRGETTVLPELPTSILQDLRMAFRTFCISEGDENQELVDSNVQDDASMTLMQKMTSKNSLDGRRQSPGELPANAVIPWDRVFDALMYAGIFYTPLAGAKRRSLTALEFEVLGHEAALMRLSHAQVSKLRDIFESADEDGSNELDVSELATTLSSAFKHHISTDEIESLCEEWSMGEHGVGEDKFIALVSRFARLHEQDWHLFKGLQDLVGEDAINAQGKLTADRLKTQAPELTKEQAEEMIWTADWRLGGIGNGETLDFCDLMCAVLLPAWRANSRLPAEVMKPVMPPNPGDWEDEPATDKDGLARAADAQEEDVALSQLEAEPEEVDPGWRKKVHLLLEEPSSSQGAQILWLVMGMLILVSVFTMVVEPLISPADKKMDDGERVTWQVLEIFFTVIFTIEYFLRLSVANAFGTQTVRGFLLSPSNICDLIAILPFYVETIIGESEGGFRLLRIVRLLRLSRITRIARLARRTPLFGPIAMVMVVIWFIYLKTS